MPKPRKKYSRDWRNAPGARPRFSPGSSLEKIQARKAKHTLGKEASVAPRMVTTSVPAPPSIVELARALRHNVDLIYEWVYSNIDYSPVWGSNRGALGTLLDRVGGPIDQAVLMVALLEESGYTADYLYGSIRLSRQQIEQLLGTDDSTIETTSESILLAGQIPYNATYNAGTFVCVDLDHVWVNVEIDGTNYVFDPSFKNYAYTTGSVNIAAAVDFSYSGLRTAARTDATSTDSFATNITGFNVDELNSSLVTYGANLLDTIRNEAFDKSVAQVVGGRQISPLSGPPVRQSDLPYQTPGVSPTLWEDGIEEEFRAKFGVEIDTIEVEFYADETYGRRLTITFDGSNHAELRLDGTLIEEGTSALTPGEFYPVYFSVEHPFADEDLNETWTQMVVAGGTYFLGTSWGAGSQSMTDYHRHILLTNIANGGADDDEDVLGEALALLWFIRRAQNDQIDSIYDQLGTLQHIWYHFAGITGYNEVKQAPFYDVGAIAFDVISRNGTSSTLEARANAATDLVSNGLEAGITRQLYGIPGINAMQMLRAAAAQTIYSVTLSNWSSVSTALTNWDDVEPVLDAQVDAGSRLIIHQNGNTTVGDFIGGGWYEISSEGVAGWVQGNLDTMLRGQLTIVLWCNYEVTQTNFFSFTSSHQSPPCTANLGITRKTGEGIFNTQNPVTITPIIWGPTHGDPACTNIEAEERNVTGPGQTFIPDTSDPYPWPPNPNLYPLGKIKAWPMTQPNGFSSFALSASQTVLGGGAAAGSPDVGDTGPTSPAPEEDPIAPFSGNFLYDRTDITVGSGSYPYSLSFSRHYDSGSSLTDGPLGFGWTHNFASQLSVTTDGSRGCGSVSPKEAAALIAHCYVMLQLNLPVCDLTDFLIASISTMWAMDQLVENTVSIRIGREGLSFAKLVDGTYNPPFGYAHVLELDETFTLKSPQQLAWNFNSDGQLETYVDPAGVTVSYNYTSGKLTSVSNGMGRGLNLSYTGDKLTSVSDGARSVSFSIDGNGNLDEFTDAESHSIVYEYASGTSKLTKYFLPATPSTAFLTNSYDSLGRIMSQTVAERGAVTFYISGWRTEIVDALGNSRVSYFNEFGSTTKQLNALGQETDFELDGLNRLVAVTYPERNKTCVVYDPSNNVTSISWQPKPGSALTPIVQSFAYVFPSEGINWNKVTTFTDGEGNETNLEYDETQGTLLKVTRETVSEGTPEIVYTHNVRGQLETRTDETGIVDKFEYSSINETLETATRDFGTGRLNLVTAFGYNTAGDVNSITDPRGNETTFDFDSERRMIQRVECSPFNFVTNWIYNENGQLITLQRQTGEVEPEFQEWNWAYLINGNVETVTDPEGNALSIAYNNNGWLTSQTDAEGRKWGLGYDSVGRLQTVKDPMGNTSERRAYTENGLVATVQNARDNVTEMQHDGFDRLVKRIYPDSTFEQFGYNLNSQVLTILTRKGDTITNTFDALTRLATRDPGPLPLQTMGYDLAGRLLSVSTPVLGGDPSSGEFSFAFDTAGRLTTQEMPDGKTVGYQLDGNGNRTRLTWPDGYYAEYVFDELNRLTDIKLNGSSSSALQFAYDDLSRRTGLTYLNGCETSYGYALNNDLTSLEHAFVGSSVEFTLGYNLVNQIIEQDVSDNSMLWKPTATAITNYAPANNLNQYPSVAGEAYGYDVNGNLTSGPYTSASFDALNRITQIVSGGTTNDYWNDPLDRQAQKKVNSTITGFVHDGLQLIAEYNSGGSLVNRYIPGEHLDEVLVQIASGTTTYLHQDWIGSTVAQTNTSCAVLNKYAYSPFGETATLSGTIFGFTGQRFDAEVNLYYFRSRYYSPVIGRFLQLDPLDHLAGDMNFYSYVGNDPTNFIDPLGLRRAYPSGFIGPLPAGDVRMSAPQISPQGTYPGVQAFPGSNNPNVNCHGTSLNNGTPTTLEQRGTRHPASTNWLADPSSLAGKPLGTGVRAQRGDVMIVGPDLNHNGRLDPSEAAKGHSYTLIGSDKAFGKFGIGEYGTHSPYDPLVLKYFAAGAQPVFEWYRPARSFDVSQIPKGSTIPIGGNPDLVSNDLLRAVKW